VDLALETFADDESVAVLITVGAYLDVSSVTTPPHIHLERFMPGSAVLERAAVAVRCGNNGTTYQVIRHGCPAVGRS
jgi:UDP:flavonoid glycosyltransferase YjiC (YdhE family)